MKHLVKLVKRLLEESKASKSMEMKITKFLSNNRNTLHTVKGTTLAEVLLGRIPHTVISLVRPCLFNAL